ncbi:MAG: hypothetical protein RBR34_09915 [Rhodospirillaceae bacterium]|nr:hypothetical protein [Rhodospirillaceae bacterium]
MRHGWSYLFSCLGHAGHALPFYVFNPNPSKPVIATIQGLLPCHAAGSLLTGKTQAYCPIDETMGGPSHG